MQADHPPAEWLGEAQAGSSNVRSKGCGAGRQVVALHGEEASRGPQVGAGAGWGGGNSLQSPVKKGQGPSVMAREAWARVFIGRAPPVLLFPSV